MHECSPCMSQTTACIHVAETVMCWPLQQEWHAQAQAAPLVIESAVADMDDALLGHTEVPGDGVGHVHDCALLLRADIVCLADHSLVQDHIEGLRHILHVEV